MRVIQFLGIFFVAAFLSVSCSDKKDAPKTDTPVSDSSSKLREFKPNSGQAVSAAPWLRTVLPEKTLAYFRFPSFWGILGQAKGNAFDRTSNNAAYAQAVNSLKQAFAKNVTNRTEKELQTILALYYQHIISPIEILAIQDLLSDKSGPGVVITAKVDFDSLDKLTQFLNSQENKHFLNVLEPAQAQKPGKLQLMGMEVFYSFSSANQQLLFYVGAPGSSPEQFMQAITNLKPNTNHPMYKMEQSLDASGQGLFAWVSPKYAGEFIQAMHLPQNSVFGIVANSGTVIDGIAAGIGVSDGKQRIKVMLDMPHTMFRAFTPLAKNDLSLHSAGQLDSVIVLNVPDSHFIKTIGALSGAGDKINQGIEALTQTLGFNPEELLDSLGPELVYLSDEAGGYAAVRVRNKEKFEGLIKQAAKQHGLVYETRSVQGKEYHHLKISYMSDMVRKLSASNRFRMEDIYVKLAASPTHIYWTYDGDYMLMASVPQILMDRQYLKKGVTVNTWLSEQIKTDVKSSLLLAATQSKGAKRWIYHQELAFMNTLADGIDAEMDLFTLPSTLEAGIGENGGFGLNIISSDNRMSIELIFDHSPFEMLSQNSMQSVFVIGVLAAIAIPAYNGYLDTSRLSAHVDHFDTAIRYIKNSAVAIESRRTKPGAACVNVMSELNQGGRGVPGNSYLPVYTTESPMPGQIQIKGLDANGCIKRRSTITITMGPPANNVSAYRYPGGGMPDSVRIEVK